MMFNPHTQPGGGTWRDNNRLVYGLGFSNTGFTQNTFEGTSTLNDVIGRHSLAFGGNYDFTQLNILNRANQVASLQYASLSN